MTKDIIDRDAPGTGLMKGDELRGAAPTSSGGLAKMIAGVNAIIDPTTDAVL